MQLPQAHCNISLILNLFLKSTSAELFRRPQSKINGDAFMLFPILLYAPASFLLPFHCFLKTSIVSLFQ